MEDIFGDAIMFVGDAERAEDEGTIYYGPLVITVAPKEGKANTLLADHLFSPSLVLAELIELGELPVSGLTVIELGAGCAVPSLLATTLAHPPSLAVITDYPDETILGNLRRNIERNAHAVTPGCVVHGRGYEWGDDVRSLLALARQASAAGPAGFDVAILSDLLHFDAEHDVLLASVTALLRRSRSSRAYVAAGTYTKPAVCAQFLQLAAQAGLVMEERPAAGAWRGTLDVHGGHLDREQLAVRKGMCRLWVGRWSDGLLKTCTE